MLGSAPASALLKVLPWFFSAPGQGPSQHLRLAFQALAWSSSHKHTDQAICSETLPQTLGFHHWPPRPGSLIQISAKLQTSIPSCRGLILTAQPTGYLLLFLSL